MRNQGAGLARGRLVFLEPGDDGCHTINPLLGPRFHAQQEQAIATVGDRSHSNLFAMLGRDISAIFS